MKPRASSLLAVLLCAHCGGDPGFDNGAGFEEPLSVRAPDPLTQAVVRATFFKGPLESDTGGPSVLGNSVDFTNSFVTAGQTNLRARGNLANTATAVLVKLDAGTGYWAVPAGAPDVNPQFPDTLTFNLYLDFARDLAPGPHLLELVGVDEAGRRGLKNNKVLTVKPLIPTAGLVVVATWDQDADVDLYVTDPNGNSVGGKRHSTLSDFKDFDFRKPLPPGTGYVDRDSNAACNIDSLRTESAVWANGVPPGLYTAYVNLFSLCGRAGVNFTVAVYRDGQLQTSQAGRLTWLDADNGKGPYLRVLQFNVPQQ